MHHTFHIPVLGLAFSVDTPLAVAKYGINSVVSIVDDELLERMRAHHCQVRQLRYVPIPASDYDSRAARVTAYLNLLHDLVEQQVEGMKAEDIGYGGDLDRYFELLPSDSPLREEYHRTRCMVDIDERKRLELGLKGKLRIGAIEANIMAKVDKKNAQEEEGVLGPFSSDALAALRGFANSRLHAGLVLSAGMNPHLYSYVATFPDFFPDASEYLVKQVILKVSDFRSAQIQAKFLAKKGVWVSEFRVESGLNCGGHAFATDGYLLGPILEEFKHKKKDLLQELFQLYQPALASKGYQLERMPHTRFTAQGGIGNADEQRFLLDHYELDATGWGSPFLLVPETTNVDNDTLERLVDAGQEDFYVSDASPLGVPFNNFRNSPAEVQRIERIASGRIGHPCTKKLLIGNTEFGETPICTASSKYQLKKIKALYEASPSEETLSHQVNKVTEKLCLCEGLAVSAYIKNGILGSKETSAVAICPGPNTAWFNRTYGLDEMVAHIYGRINLLEGSKRPNLFVNELLLYVAHFKQLMKREKPVNEKKHLAYIEGFRNQLLEGIAYYKKLSSSFEGYPLLEKESPLSELLIIEGELQAKDTVPQ